MAVAPLMTAVAAEATVPHFVMLNVACYFNLADLRADGAESREICTGTDCVRDPSA
jgi:hypothetical protein